MKISRLVVKNFRSFETLDVTLHELLTCIIGENNTGKTNLLHAMRLCLDSSLSSTFRSLIATDIHTGVDFTSPMQVLVGMEITDYQGKTNEEALVAGWQIAPNKARIFYRFRPKAKTREAIAAAELASGDLDLEHYGWEIAGSGDPAIDLKDIEWDTEVGSSIRFQDLQSFLVVYLPAIRDVESELRNWKSSPLSRLIGATDIPVAEQQALIEILEEANRLINASPTIANVATAIDEAFKEVSGKAFSLDVGLGLADPTFEAIIKSLKILLSNNAMSEFEPSKNGLGLNNILYIAILIEYFRKRSAKNQSAGQLLLIEEPEAHLHPQLQSTLVESLRNLPFQTFLTTHSTQITSQAKLSSLVALTNTGASATVGKTLINNPYLGIDEALDLERYLDATKSNLLYARKVILVEGAAELFLLPPLIKATKGIDLEREGISVISINGAHFEAYTNLFNEESLPKYCAVIGDADQPPAPEDEFDDVVPVENFADLECEHVKTFIGKTTFEMELTRFGNFPMLIATCLELKATKTAAYLQSFKALYDSKTEQADKNALAKEVRAKVLRTAKRFGKARFAQIASRNIPDTGAKLPDYIDEAVTWLMTK